MPLPLKIKDIAQQLQAFKDFLCIQGCDICEPKSSWELVRWTRDEAYPLFESGSKEHFIIYKRKNGRLTWPPGTEVFWNDFQLDTRA